jgi:hypothetical protein
MTPRYGSKQMPIKTRAWLEAECMKLARQISGGSQIECVMIRRLHTKVWHQIGRSPISFHSLGRL